MDQKLTAIQTYFISIWMFRLVNCHQVPNKLSMTYGDVSFIPKKIWEHILCYVELDAKTFCTLGKHKFILNPITNQNLLIKKQEQK